MAKINPKNEYIKLVIIIIVILLILGGFILYVSIPFFGTKTAVLATQPVDPFDLIRGQYIIIRYEIGNIPTIQGVEVGEKIYVLLKEDNEGISRFDGTSLIRPSSNKQFIKGKIISKNDNSMNLEFGIEQYFFERGAKFSTRDMTVRIKLSDFGGSRIIELLQDGDPIDIEYRNKTLTS